jgi:hypothetical protein
LQVGTLFGNNSSLYWTDLEANAAVNTGGKVNPVPIRSFAVFARAIMNTGDWAGIHTVCNALTHIRHNCMSHWLFSLIRKQKGLDPIN